MSLVRLVGWGHLSLTGPTCRYEKPQTCLPSASEPWMHLWERLHGSSPRYDLSRWLVEVASRENLFIPGIQRLGRQPCPETLASR